MVYFYGPRIYFVIKSVYILTIFIHPTLPPSPVSGNHKSDFIFYEFVFEG